MSHKARVVWVFAEKSWQVVCVECGTTLLDDIEKLTMTFPYPGLCAGSKDSLGVQVIENIGLADYFGGKDR